MLGLGYDEATRCGEWGKPLFPPLKNAVSIEGTPQTVVVRMK